MTSEEERAIFIGERLFGYSVNFIGWLSTPNGIHAIKQKMIERGWEWYCRYFGHNDESYAFNFCKYGERQLIIELGAEATTEVEAILTATEKALRSEDANRN